MIEKNPDLFHRSLYQPLLKKTRQQLADFLNVKLDEVVLVSNTSMGINTVLRNFIWEEGDVIFACTYRELCLMPSHNWPYFQLQRHITLSLVLSNISPTHLLTRQ